MFKKLLQNFIFWVLILAGVVFAIWHTYVYVYGDSNLLSFETCLKYAEEDVLGKRLYSETCARSSYFEKVDLLGSSSEINKSGAYEFKFHPLSGKEKVCPAVTIAISRHTGEAWIINVEK